MSLFSWIWADSLTITIAQGTLLGGKSKSRNGTEYRSFLGIPYAKPPVGQLRFQVGLIILNNLKISGLWKNWYRIGIEN